MNRHLSLRSGNPTLNAKTFTGFDMTAGGSMTIMAVSYTHLTLPTIYSV